MGVPYRQIRADYDKDSIIVYQAYREAIGRAAVAAGRFVDPFSFNRMTWIKPSFLWMMERSNWGQKDDQQWVLGVRLRRAGWEEALRQAVLTSPERDVYPNADTWQRALDQATVHVQWDPDRSIRGTKLDHRSIQVGLSRRIIRTYVDEWILEIVDLRDHVRRILSLCKQGDFDRAQRLLPTEKPYPVPADIAGRIGVTGA